jgi:hypothetical protein
MPIMRFQFSLATLLVCMTELGVVGAVAIRMRVVVVEVLHSTPTYIPPGRPVSITPVKTTFTTRERPPTSTEVAVRFATWGTPAIVATLAVLWAIRHLKSRRHIETAVG